MTRRRQTAAIAAVAGAVGLIALYAGRSILPGARSRTVQGLDSSVVAVLPFHVDEADPALTDLRDWLQDLLVARLTGQGSPRAMEPRDVADALRRSSASLAGEMLSGASNGIGHELGAGLLLRGEVHGAPGGLSLAATLVAVPSGVAQAEAQVHGSADSLPYLADRLTARLLAVRAASEGEDLAALSNTSLAALRAYLAGRAVYRRGDIHEAEEYFNRALYFDSTFAPAGLGVATVQTNYWHWRSGDERWQADAVWSLRHRMSPADHALLIAYLGPHYPRPSTLAELIAAGEQAARVAPQRVEAWYIIGAYLWRFGPVIGAPDWKARSIAALHRALALDATHAPTLEILLPLAAATGDTAAVRRYAELYLAHNAGALVAGFLRWRAAVALGDSVALVALRPQFALMHEPSLWGIIRWSQQDGVGLGDADSAVQVLLRTEPAVGHAIAMQITLRWLLNRGRPAEASRILRDLNAGSPAWNLGLGVEFPVYAALYWDSDTSDAVVAARRLETIGDSAPTDNGEVHGRQSASCALAHWRAASGDFAGARAALARIGQVPAPRDVFDAPTTAVCVAAVGAMLAASRHQHNAAVALQRLDSLLRTTWDFSQDVLIGNLVAARLYEARGDLARALDAVRRARSGFFLSTQRREEGRLAALNGDRVGAIRAYRHYLALRSNPEPELRPEVAWVRAELQRLERAAAPEASPR